jgi:hypothetical protein
MHSRWTANGAVMPRSASAPATGRDTPRSANDWDDMYGSSCEFFGEIQ